MGGRRGGTPRRRRRGVRRGRRGRSVSGGRRGRSHHRRHVFSGRDASSRGGLRISVREQEDVPPRNSVPRTRRLRRPHRRTTDLQLSETQEDEKGLEGKISFFVHRRATDGGGLRRETSGRRRGMTSSFFLVVARS